ncbi:MAG: GNAT family N-acetyltransferase [Chloroflexi bacterium]|nr:GNAT family N-acetyltransferase [Chloroflexota bacterium]
MAIFDSNTPKYFASHEREDFHEFLEAPGGAYFVVEDNGVLVACGGLWSLDEPFVALTWGMVERSRHKQGIGRWLLLRRLQMLCAQPGTPTAKIDTSQHSAPFFAKMGFQTEKVVDNGFAPGIDLVEMHFVLDDVACVAITEKLALTQPLYP